MANLLRIRDIAKTRGITIRELAHSIGITEQGLQKLIRENSTKVETLETIARILEVSISVFFDEEDKEKEQDQLSPDRFLSIIESQQRTIENLSKR